jgi:hypothetical protein
MRKLTLVAALLWTLPWTLGRAGEAGPSNLALRARASAFESYQGMSASLAIDGNMGTRWSGIPGHNSAGWFELDWDRPVRVGEVVIFQHDRYVKEMDLQAWDQENRAWVTLEHLGSPDGRLPRVVVCRFKSRSTSQLRLANITNGPGFTEVQVFEEPFSHPPAINLASDADGRFIGMISDDLASTRRPAFGNQGSMTAIGPTSGCLLISRWRDFNPPKGSAATARGSGPRPELEGSSRRVRVANHP